MVDTGIANEKDWGISLVNENVKESGTNEDGSTWYRESGEDLGEKGYRCRWTKMGGQSHDGSSEWKETVQMIECFDLSVLCGCKCNLFEASYVLCILDYMKRLLCNCFLMLITAKIVKHILPMRL